MKDFRSADRMPLMQPQATSRQLLRNLAGVLILCRETRRSAMALRRLSESLRGIGTVARSPALRVPRKLLIATNPVNLEVSKDSKRKPTSALRCDVCGPL